MTVRTYQTIWCDGKLDDGTDCSVWIDVDISLYVTAQRKELRKRGWSHRPGRPTKDFCPSCTKEGRNEVRGPSQPSRQGAAG